MKKELYDALSDNPIILAIKDQQGLKKSIEKEDAAVVFVLYGEIGSIADVVQQLKEAGKQVILHMDLIAGLSSREDAVNFVSRYTKADGIISTRFDQIRRGKELGLTTIYRIFVIDSKALDNVNPRTREYADIIEILPGLMPKIIRYMSERLKVPVIAGGLISDREDVIQALDAGAIAVSSTNTKVWEM